MQKHYTFHSVSGTFADFKIEAPIADHLLLTIHYCLAEHFEERVQIFCDDELLYDGNQYVSFYDKIQCYKDNRRLVKGEDKHDR